MKTEGGIRLTTPVTWADTLYKAFNDVLAQLNRISVYLRLEGHIIPSPRSWLFLSVLLNISLTSAALAQSQFISNRGFKIQYEISGSDAISTQDISPQNGIPDYVEAIANGLDQAYDWYLSILPAVGYKLSTLPEVEIKDRHSILFICSVVELPICEVQGGQYIPANNKIYFDNDDLWPTSAWAKNSGLGLQALADWVSAHELFHWVQDKQSIFNNSVGWLNEGSARWIEGPVVNRHPIYDSYELNNSLEEQSFDPNSGRFAGYAVWQFWHYLSSYDRNATLKIIRRLLPDPVFGQSETLSAAILAETGKQFSEIFTEFAIKVVRRSNVGNINTGTFKFGEANFDSENLSTLPVDETKPLPKLKELAAQFRRLEWSGPTSIQLDVFWNVTGGPVFVAILRDQIGGNPLVTELIPNSSVDSHSVIVDPNTRITILFVNGANSPKDVTLRLVRSNLPDTIKPSVSLTAPISGAIVNATVPVTANASDANGVTKVDFYLNNGWQKTDSSGPYTWIWDTTLVPNGPYALVVKAYDPAGNIGTSASVNVTVNNGADTAPPVISSVRATTTATTATITWVTNEAANSQVEYGLSMCPPCALLSPLNSALSTNHSVTITGLSPLTAYNFRVRSRDGSNNLAVSNNNTFATTTAGNSGPAVTLGKPNGGENWPVGSVQNITWSAVDDVAVTEIRLFYSTDAGNNWITIQSGLTNTGSFAWAVPNTPSNAVRVGVIALDGAAASAWDTSNGNFTISTSCALPAAPQLGNIVVIDGNYTVGWNAVSGTTSYRLEEDINSSFTNPIPYTTSSTTLSRFFAGKASGTYYYRVRATNGCGDGVRSGVQSVTITVNQGPGQITAVSPGDDATNQPLNVNLCWSASHPGGESLRFNIYVVPADTEFFFPNNIKSSGQTGTCYSATNLPYNTRVSWGIEAIDSTGDVRFSPMFHFNTIADSGAPTGGILVNNDAATTTSYAVTLNLSASDSASGVQHMRFSNDGLNWSYWQNYGVQFPWNLADWQYGGRAGLTTYTVYAQFRDQQLNISGTFSDSITKVAGTPGNIILNNQLYQTIQDAINAANPGDTVYLTEGVFNVTGEASALRPHDPNRNVGIVMRSEVSLRGAGANKTTINFQNSFFAIVDADNSLIEGIKIANPSFPSSLPASVLIESSGSKVKNNTISGSYYGIQVGYNSQHPGSNLEVSNNLITGNSEGMRIYDGSNISVVNNTVVNNAPNGGVVTHVASTTITNNIVFNNGYGLGAPLGVTPTIRYNDVFNNAGGDYNDIPNQTGLNGNISTDPQFVNAAGGDYRLSSGSPAINAGTDVGIPFAGIAPDMGAFEFNATGTIQVTSNQTGANFTVVGPQATYNGSGTNWSQANVPLGVYTITFTPIANLYSPPYQAKTLFSGQTLIFDGNYANDAVPPTGTMAVNFSEYGTGSPLVSITFDLSDAVAGLGAGSLMKFSNDGVNWSPDEPYSTVKKNWDLISFGGSSVSGMKTVQAQVSDSLGNWTAFSDDILYVPNRQILEVPSQYPTIQAAIDVAQPGDMVHVAPGNYSQNVTLRDGVTLQGSGPDKTKFVAGGGVPLVEVHANTKIEGFGGIWTVVVRAGPATISNNVFSAPGNQSVAVANGVSAVIVRNNLFDGNGIGVITDQDPSIVVENNTFVNILGSAIRTNVPKPNTKVISRNNIFAFSNIAVEEGNHDPTHQHVFSSFNTYWNNVTNFSGPNLAMVGGDIQADPLFADRTGKNFHSLPGSSSIDSGHPEARFNDPDGSRNDRGAYGGPGQNTAPVADFTITPDVGGVGTFFTFDASNSFDLESVDSNVLVRWDFDGDGVWDTAFSPLKIASEQFSALGTFDVILEVRDENGFLATVTKQVTVNNQGPNSPSNPSPSDGSNNQVVTATLTWSGGDPDPTDTVTYDVYFGTTANPPLVSSDQPGTSFTPASLTEFTFYYWKVVAKDNHGNTTSGPLWSFLTVPADIASPDTNITNGPTGTITANSATFDWTGTDNVTSTANLVYAYRLDPIELSFSAFGAATTKSYSNLANGSYTIFVKAKDEAGNEDLSPASRLFTVNVLPIVTLVATTPTAVEGGASGAFTVTRTGSTSSSLTVNYTVGGSAANGVDYQTLSGSVVIAAGQSSAVITVTPIDDTVVGELNETVMVQLQVNAAYNLGSPNSATVTITDNDSVLPTVMIVATDPTATEQGLSTGFFTVSRTGSTGSALTVFYTLGGTAVSGTDYTLTPAPSSVTIPAGSSSKTITVTPINDVTMEGNETVVATLSPKSNYTVGSGNSATVTIVSNETVTITATDPTATESGPTTGTFRVSRTGSTASSLTVFYTLGGTAVSGTDYTLTPAPSSVTIPAGSSSKTITVTPINDVAMEGNETVVVTLSPRPNYTVGSPSSATVTLVSNERVTISATDSTATESGPTTGTFRVSRTGSTSASLTVNYTVGGTATNGVDYQTLTGSVVIPAGVSSATITVAPINDVVMEGNETVVVTLSPMPNYTVGSPGSATVTIVSDEKVTITATDPTATESGLTTGTFRVSRTGSTASSLTVFYTRGGTAVFGTDYTLTPAPSSVTIPAGSSSKTITVTPINDVVTEGNETVIMTLSPRSNYTVGSPSGATVTLVSNE